MGNQINRAVQAVRYRSVIEIMDDGDQMETYNSPASSLFFLAGESFRTHKFNLPLSIPFVCPHPTRHLFPLDTSNPARPSAPNN
jgi:hypothetical protein